MSTFFFFNDTATTEIYTLSLHDALPIYDFRLRGRRRDLGDVLRFDGITKDDTHGEALVAKIIDRKSTRLNSSHLVISYAVFCLKKKIGQVLAPHGFPLTAAWSSPTHIIV